MTQIQKKKHGRSLIAGVNALFREIETNKGEAAILKDVYEEYYAERGGLVGFLDMARFVIPPLNRILHSLNPEFEGISVS